MKNLFRLGVLVAVLGVPGLANAQLFPNLGGQRAGISGLTFLKFDVSPRSAGLGGANVALSGDPYALNWNPAAITDVGAANAAVGYTDWFAGVNLGYVAFSKPFGRNQHYFGLQVQALNSGQMERRTEFQPQGDGTYFTVSNVAAGISYAKALTDRFSLGANLKYVNETMDAYVAHTVAVDLGFAYRVDWKDLRFAVLLQSFGPNSRLNGDPLVRFGGQAVELENYPSPTLFAMGVSMMPLNTDEHQLLTAFQLNHPNDNAENFRFGVEYGWRKLLFARLGYKIFVKDQNLPTGGVGVRARVGKHPLQIDYAVEPTRFMGLQHRVGLTFTLNTDRRTDSTSPAAASTGAAPAPSN
jgi:hypothetical protein